MALRSGPASASSKQSASSGQSAPSEHTAFSEQEGNELAAAVEGPVFLPEDEGYAEEAAGANTILTHRPLVTVGATGAADVRAAVRFARDHDLPLAVLATGHGPSTAVKDAVLVTTRRMTGVEVDPVERTARIEAGVQGRRLVDAAVEHGLAPLVGSSPQVGVVGYTLGGGLSVTMGRAFGWAADYVRSIDVVTPDGESRHASPDSEPDLFWALLGARSNFGIVTAMTFSLFSVERLYGGGLLFAGEHARAVMHAYREFAARAPENMMSSLALIRAPDLPSTPDLMRGKLVVQVRISYLGSEQDGNALIAPLRSAAPTIMDSVAERPYREFAAISPSPPEPMAAVEHFGLLDELGADTVDAILDVAGPESDSLINLVDLRQLGGALARRNGPDNAVGNRDAPFAIFTVSVAWSTQVDVRKSSGPELMNHVRPWLREKKISNFLSTADAAADQVHLAFEEQDYRRLRSLKARYDPRNALRFNHNIPPESPQS
jgi:FAD/FMN-containing dehydrogenase